MTGLEKLLRWHSMRGGISTQEATATGNPATFETTLVRPLVKCEAAFMYTQEGAGNPSPNNIRNFFGRTGITIYHGGDNAENVDIYPVNWQISAGTLYGGYFDIISGSLVATEAMITLNTATMNGTENYPGWSQSGAKEIVGKVDGQFTIPLNVGNRIAITTNGTGTYSTDMAYLPKSVYNLSQSEWKSMAIDVQMILKYKEPIVYQLDPIIIRSFSGENNIWSNANGDMTVKYVKKG